MNAKDIAELLADSPKSLAVQLQVYAECLEEIAYNLQQENHNLQQENAELNAELGTVRRALQCVTERVVNKNSKFD